MALPNPERARLDYGRATLIDCWPRSLSGAYQTWVQYVKWLNDQAQALFEEGDEVKASQYYLWSCHMTEVGDWRFNWIPLAPSLSHLRLAFAKRGPYCDLSELTADFERFEGNRMDMPFRIQFYQYRDNLSYHADRQGHDLGYLYQNFTLTRQSFSEGLNAINAMGDPPFETEEEEARYEDCLDALDAARWQMFNIKRGLWIARVVRIGFGLDPNDPDDRTPGHGYMRPRADDQATSRADVEMFDERRPSGREIDKVDYRYIISTDFADTWNQANEGEASYIGLRAIQIIQEDDP